MAATFSTGIISVIYKFRLQKFRLYHLHYNTHKSYARNLRCNNWWKPISCYQKQQYYTIFSTIRHELDVSHKLNSNLAWISSWIFHRVDWDFTATISLLCHKCVICKFILSFLSLVMETNLFTRLKLRTLISNLKLKQWSPIWIFYP